MNSSNADPKQTTDMERRYRFRFSSEALSAVDELRVLLGNVSMEEALRRAIGDELFICRNRAKGYRFLLEKNGNYREFFWSDLS